MSIELTAEFLASAGVEAGCFIVAGDMPPYSIRPLEVLPDDSEPITDAWLTGHPALSDGNCLRIGRYITLCIRAHDMAEEFPGCKTRGDFRTLLRFLKGGE